MESALIFFPIDIHYHSANPNYTNLHNTPLQPSNAHPINEILSLHQARIRQQFKLNRFRLSLKIQMNSFSSSRSRNLRSYNNHFYI